MATVDKETKIIQYADDTVNLIYANFLYSLFIQHYYKSKHLF